MMHSQRQLNARMAARQRRTILVRQGIQCYYQHNPSIPAYEVVNNTTGAIINTFPY